MKMYFTAQVLPETDRLRHEPVTKCFSMHPVCTCLKLYAVDLRGTVTLSASSAINGTLNVIFS